jgi:hypothetical protein
MKKYCVQMYIIFMSLKNLELKKKGVRYFIALPS